MKKYKLIKKYPESPELNTVVEYTKTEYGNTKYRLPDILGELGVYVYNCEKYPEFWQELVEQTPFMIHQSGIEITGVTRIKDNVYFSKGMRVKMPGSDSLGFIYGFKFQNGILKIDHTFSFLMDKAGITDHLEALRPCLYTKEDLQNYEKY